MRRGIIASLLVLITCALARPAAADDLDRVDPVQVDQRLGPAREVALVGFPVELLMTSLSGAPMLSLEARIALGRFALTVRPIVAWVLPGTYGPEHGAGVGAAVGVQWYTRRALAGPYVALDGGDIEVFASAGHGRTAGGTLVFGYALSWDDGAVLCLGVGFGYWHKMGAIASGAPGLPELLALHVDTGWGW